MLDINTSDGRFLFFLPWEGSTLVGTTDVKGAPDSSARAPQGGNPNQHLDGRTRSIRALNEDQDLDEKAAQHQALSQAQPAWLGQRDPVVSRFELALFTPPPVF